MEGQSLYDFSEYDVNENVYHTLSEAEKLYDEWIIGQHLTN